ncbi:MAG: hypothetical protein DRJ13_00655 [Bacteroidetes bacterium]|nr:MAG: hypothetical protein DRJ13_00655 [Bacteroidota bacterium]
MKKIAMLFILLLFSINVFAQTNEEKKALGQANNPLANSTAFNIQNYYYSKLAGTENIANTSWLRYVAPLFKGRVIIRASAPFPTKIPVNDTDYKSGLGNMNIFGAYIVSKDGAPATIGLGPLVVAPTVTENMGSNKWQAGGAFVYFNAKSTQVQFGGLVTYQHSVGGSSDDPTVNAGAIQPFYFFQLGGGTYLRGAPIWLLDFENNLYNVPIGLGIGKVVKVGKTMFNMFIEPQYVIYNKGNGLPLFSIYAGLNMQFY